MYGFAERKAQGDSADVGQLVARELNYLKIISSRAAFWDLIAAVWMF